jgi:UDP-N-acetylmuramate dehydrogenase
MKNRLSLIHELITLAGRENLLIDEPMANHTTFKVGGPADFLLRPTTIEALSNLMIYASFRELPYFVLGNGSNLIISDKGIRGLVISTRKMTHVSYRDKLVTAFCGLELTKLSHSTAERELSGLEFACGIPGTVGGAVYMNAGAYEGEISKVLVSSDALAVDEVEQPGQAAVIHTLDKNDHAFSYRHSVFQDEPLVHLSSTFKLEHRDKRKIRAEIRRFTEARAAKQPLELPSAGSVFRRPPGYYVGQLIEECGLKGFRIGDAAVSDKHCGFIVNLGHATAADIRTVISHIQKTIFERAGITLQTEVKFIGE